MLDMQWELHKGYAYSRGSINASYTVEALYMLGTQQEFHKC